MLGEPALVPPTAKERMYALVQGREAIPYRKAAPAARAPGDALDEDEALGGKWLSWSLPVAGLLLVVALGLAVYQVLPDRTRDDRLGARSPEQWTHGSSALRVKWFRTGFDSGSAGDCDTSGVEL